MDLLQQKGKRVYGSNADPNCTTIRLEAFHRGQYLCCLLYPTLPVHPFDASSLSLMTLGDSL